MSDDQANQRRPFDNDADADADADADKRGRSRSTEPVRPQAGSPKGAVHVPGPSLDQGGGDDPHDGRVHRGLSGDDGAHQPTDSRATSTSGMPGADLGAHGDTRNHDMPTSVERVTGSETPAQGGIEGSPGGPKDGAKRIPGDDDPSDVLADTPDTHNAQRKSRI